MIARAARTPLVDSLADTPVVLVQGPRQAGKSTLVQSLTSGDFKGTMVTLDDPIILAEATANPLGFLRGFNLPLIIDEVQRAPELMLSIKRVVDENRQPGMFVLTGSANVLLLPKVADSLAGRIEVIELLPLSQAELENTSTNFVDKLFSHTSPPRGSDKEPPLRERIVRGGFPEPAQRDNASRRDAWFKSYIRTMLDRDVRDLANIAGLSQMPRVLSLLAARSGQPLNVASLSVDTGIPHTSLTRYVEMLRALYFVHMVPAWSFSTTDSKLARSPKAYMVDTGLMAHLAGHDAKALQDPFRLVPYLNTFVAGELEKLARFSSSQPKLYHLRTVKHKQVEFILEGRDGRVIGLDTCAAQAVTSDDIEGLKFLKELAQDRFFGGIVLYMGSDLQSLGGGLWAVPISALWS